MTQSGRLPPGSPNFRHEASDVLFTNIPALDRAPRSTALRWPASVAVHAIVIGLLAAVVPRPPTVKLDEPHLPPSLRFRFGEPPAVAPPPLPRGRPRVAALEQRAFVAPIEPETTPQDLPVTPRETLTASDAPEAQPDGSPNGTDSGRPGGQKDGVDGGKLGGNGVDPNGCFGCAGQDPPGDYDQPPRLLDQPRPVYPQDAFVKKVQGTVMVRILIGPDGRVQAARIAKSIPLLDDAALAAVRQWRFAPARHHGQPVAVYADAPVRFAIY